MKLSENTPLHKALYSELFARINRLTAGSKIPTEEELVVEFGISRSTVHSVLSRLTEQGIIYRIRSKGTFVSERKKLRQELTLLLPGPGILNGSGNSAFFVKEFLNGIMDEGLKKGIAVNTMMCTTDHCCESLIPEHFLTLPANANIIIPSEWWCKVFPALVESGCRVVCFNRQMIHKDLKDTLKRWYMLTYDTAAIAADAVSRLVVDARQRIAVIDEMTGWYRGNPGPVKSGYLNGLARNMRSLDPELAPEFDSSHMISEALNGNDTEICEFFSQWWHRVHFDAIILPSYPFVKPLVKFLQSQSIKIPEDVAIICIDDWSELENLSPSISCYGRHPYEYGIEAVRGFEEMDFAGREKFLSYNFIGRESTRSLQQISFNRSVPVRNIKAGATLFAI